MKQLSFLLIIVPILFTACSKDNKIERISFPNDKRNFDQSLKIIENIKIYSDSIKIYSINKITNLGDDKYLFMDAIKGSVFFLNKKDNKFKEIAKKGNGPGEFNAIVDYTIDDKGNLFVLDLLRNMIGKYNSNFDFLRNYTLSFSHRNPRAIGFFRGKFIISALNNLTVKSSRNKFDFLDYSDNSFLNVYNENFELENSIIHPHEALWTTMGVLSLPYGNLAPFSKYKGKIFITTQEGYYDIYELNTNYTIDKIINVIGTEFKQLKQSDINQIKISDRKINLSQEQIGKLAASYSQPISINITEDYLCINIGKPYGNYYPEYDGSKEREFYIDIFKIINNKLSPIASGIESFKWIVGVDKDNCIYLANTFEKNNNGVEIEKVKIIGK